MDGDDLAYGGGGQWRAKKTKTPHSKRLTHSETFGMLKSPVTPLPETVISILKMLREVK